MSTLQTWAVTIATACVVGALMFFAGRYVFPHQTPPPPSTVTARPDSTQGDSLRVVLDHVNAELVLTVNHVHQSDSARRAQSTMVELWKHSYDLLYAKMAAETSHVSLLATIDTTAHNEDTTHLRYNGKEWTFRHRRFTHAEISYDLLHSVFNAQFVVTPSQVYYVVTDSVTTLSPVIVTQKMNLAWEVLPVAGGAVTFWGIEQKSAAAMLCGLGLIIVRLLASYFP